MGHNQAALAQKDKRYLSSPGQRHTLVVAAGASSAIPQEAGCGCSFSSLGYLDSRLAPSQRVSLGPCSSQTSISFHQCLLTQDVPSSCSAITPAIPWYAERASRELACLSATQVFFAMYSN